MDNERKQRHQPPDWEEAKPFFRRDGMLRDIQCDGSREVWRLWLRALAATSWRAEFRVRGVRVAPSLDFPRAAPEDEAPVLFIALATGPQVNTFFFDSEEIDADLLPEDFTNQDQWSELLGLIKLMGDATGGQVRLSPEAQHKCPWLIYNPGQSAWMTIGEPGDNIAPY